MTRLRWIYTLVAVSWCVTTVLSAQPTVSAVVSSDTITIGDKITVDYTIRVPVGVEVQSIDFSSLDSTRNVVYSPDEAMMEEYMDWGVLTSSVWLVSGRVVTADHISGTRVNSETVITGSIDIAIYSVGLYQLMDPVVTTSVPQAWMRLQPARVVVLPPSIDPANAGEKLAIKDIIKEPVRFSDFLPYLMGVLAIAFFIWSLMRWRAAMTAKIEVPAEEEPEEILPPHIIALTSLDDLEREELWQNGAIKDYQTRLTTIVRKYLEGRYDIPALELTTDEITKALARKGVRKEHDSSMRRLLQMADLVKFAKARPDDSIHAEFMAEARAFVTETMEAIVLPLEGES